MKVLLSTESSKESLKKSMEIPDIMLWTRRAALHQEWETLGTYGKIFLL